MVIFASLPASATAYFWVGMDGLTLLLMLAVVASDRRPGSPDCSASPSGCSTSNRASLACRSCSSR